MEAKLNNQVDPGKIMQFGTGFLIKHITIKKEIQTMKNILNNIILILLTLFIVTSYAQDSGEKYYLSISHEVTDYTSWKTGYDKDLAPRKNAGLTDIFVKQDINNTSLITAFFEVNDLAKAKAFVSDPRLKEAMAKAGVSSTPVIVFYESATKFDKINPSALITTVTHSVKDFSSWKKVYDSAEKLRQNAGVNDYLLLRSLSDKNLVTVLGTSSSAAKFNQFVSNPDLKTAMDNAGVISKPEVRVML